MKKLSIKFIIIIAMIVFFIIIVNRIFMQFVPISKDHMQEEFYKHKQSVEEAANYFQNLNYSGIYITCTDKKGNMYVENDNEEMGKTIEIEDATVVENINNLFKKYHYSVVFKNKNGIYFQRYSNRLIGRGVVYSTDGERPRNEYLTILEPLGEENWYYYQEE